MNTGDVKQVHIPAAGNKLEGELTIPEGAESVVIFSHGSGSSRRSARNQMVARRLQQNNIGTLLFDLLTEEEDRNYYNRFNIDLLTGRLVNATKWVGSQKETRYCHLGYFGASTGAASALKAAAQLPQIEAVVSRGGRPDLALDILPNVKVPVLLKVGSLDFDVLELNDVAYTYLGGEKKLIIIDGATHLFEEEGALDKVADGAILWFQKYLRPKIRSKTGIYV